MPEQYLETDLCQYHFSLLSQFISHRLITQTPLYLIRRREIASESISSNKRASITSAQPVCYNETLLLDSLQLIILTTEIIFQSNFEMSLHTENSRFSASRRCSIGLKEKGMLFLCT
jgi:hypothetical protein